jgi:uncharacterized protein
MGKLLVLIALVVIAFWLLKRALRRDEIKNTPPVQGDLVACAHCGVNLPREEARSMGEQLFCSEEHARLGKR